MDDAARDDGAGEQRTLGQQVGRGLSWSLAGQLVNRLAIFGSGIVLARILAQEDFGVYAVALLVVNVLGAINELGVIPAVVRWSGDLRRAAATGTTMATGFSLALFGLVWVTAPGFAAAVNTPEATGVVRLIAFTLVVDGASGVSQALLHRTFAQRQQTIAETLGNVVYVAVAVVLAVQGAEAWSIAWGRVLGSVVTGGLFVVYAPFRCRPGFDRSIAWSMGRFGIPLALSALVWEGVLNLDYLVVGRVLGTASLGVYLLAFNLSSWPVSTVSMAVAKVSFAGFSRLVEDRARFTAAFVRSFGVAVSATAPLVVVLTLLAPEVIRFVYGEKWLAAAPVVRFLLVLGGLRVLTELMFDFVAADGRSDRNLWLRLTWLVALVPALFVGAQVDGIRGVGAAHVVVALVVVTPLLLRLLTRSGVEVSALARQLVRPLIGAAASLAAMLALLPFVSGDLLRLVLVGGLGGLVYTAVILPGNELVRWSWEQIRPQRVSA